MALTGKVAIVTGAARGIGQACAERLAREGAKVIVADRDEAGGERIAADIREDGGEAAFVSCDVSERLDVRNLLAATLETYDAVDLLVNNAGIIDDAPFLELSEAEFDRVLATNLKGAFLLGQAVARQMVSQVEAGAAPGAIVNMSSINAHFALPDHVAYSVSKGGLTQLTKAMALALAPHGIRVNAVAPGSILTPLLAEVAKDETMRRRILSRTPLGRLGRPEEIAGVVAFLLGEDAAYVTGETITADGGRMPLNYTVPVEKGGSP